ncbi:hypothetical protein OPV09_16995 [Janthinobacterium sp. TB1-E2]|uniref:Uncharacterized protein n=1 Tax=Janthinobacterium aestuarii TaxID=2985511 RepID=A0ABZ2GIJ6_9BURK
METRKIFSYGRIFLAGIDLGGKDKMLDIATTYLIVSAPVNVGEIHGDCLRSIDTVHGTAIYRGMDRDPWRSLDTAFFAKRLGYELVNLRRKIGLAANKIYSCGICRDLSEVQTILSLSESGREKDDLIWIDNSGSIPPDDARFFGLRFLCGWLWSVNSAGMFEQPEIF